MATILIVDDEKHLDILLSQKFRREIKKGTYKFVFARHGREALERIQEDPHIALVISDINMPEMDGLTLLEHLDTINPRIKTIIASAYNDVSNVKAAMERGAYDFITKPIDLKELGDTLQRVLTHQDLNRQDLRAQQTQKSLAEELAIASKLQNSLLPTHFPHQETVQLFATMRSALEIGGDFYDYFWLSPSELGVVMADVSGKGISAALFMGMARTVMKLTAMEASSPSDCLMKVNRQLAVQNPTAMFVTLFYGVLSLTTGEFCYANAGHCPGYVEENGHWKLLDMPPGLPLGVEEETLYTHKNIFLSPGNSLFLYTDGITEAMNAKERPFDKIRLERSLRLRAGTFPEPLIQGVIQDVKDFVGTSPASDDLTCLALMYAPGTGTITAQNPQATNLEQRPASPL